MPSDVQFVFVNGQRKPSHTLTETGGAFNDIRCKERCLGRWGPWATTEKPRLHLSESRSVGIIPIATHDGSKNVFNLLNHNGWLGRVLAERAASSRFGDPRRKFLKVGTRFSQGPKQIRQSRCHFVPTVTCNRLDNSFPLCGNFF